MRRFIYIFALLFLGVTSNILIAQEDIFSKLLEEEVEVIDPQYKPVIGLGVGMINFFGDVSNNYYSPLMGKPAAKITITTFVDSRNHYFKANFFLLYGTLSGEKNDFNVNDIPYNINFESSIINFGINVNYGFGHFYEKKKHFLNPFIAIGIESVQFNSKRDSMTSSKVPYNYWTDGTIRNIPESERLSQDGQLLDRDYIYETDLRDEVDYGLGKYAQNTFAIPIDIGLDFNVSERVTLSMGASFNFLMSDKIDHVSHENTKGVIGDKKNDKFVMSYLTLHLDLFSDPTTIIIDKLFADIDFDYTLYDDEDNDMVFDGWDECPDTPAKAQVDSVGCPFDKDKDGVPDFRDEELNTPQGVFVDDDGIQITEDELLAMLERSSNAVRRDEVDLYIRKILGYSKYFGTANLEIPLQYKFVDVDEDEYISFDELLMAIDKFFDFESDLSPDDIYELNSFFFAQ